MSEHRHQWFKTFVYDQGELVMFSRCPECGVADSERGATRDIFARHFGATGIPAKYHDELETFSDCFPSWAQRGAVMTSEHVLAHSGAAAKGAAVP